MKRELIHYLIYLALILALAFISYQFTKNIYTVSTVTAIGSIYSGFVLLGIYFGNQNSRFVIITGSFAVILTIIYLIVKLN